MIHLVVGFLTWGIVLRWEPSQLAQIFQENLTCCLLAFPGKPGNLFLNFDINLITNGIKMVFHLMIVKPHHFQTESLKGPGAFFIMLDIC